MVIKVSQEQLNKLDLSESQQYINELHKLIIKHSPSLREDSQLLQRLKDADAFVKLNCFTDKKTMANFIITNAYEPYFYKNKALEQWLLDGTESAECEYIKYKQIKRHLMRRVEGETL